jgi:uncharacterized protein
MSMGADTLLDQDPGRINQQVVKSGQRPAPKERAFGLRIARDGRWFHYGSPIERSALVKLFATVLRREADGSHWLVTPVERGRIEVEDAPFVGVELAALGRGRGRALRLRTNLDEWVTVGRGHPLRTRRPADQPSDAGLVPYVEIRNGLEARLARPVYYELMEFAEEHQVGAEIRLGVWSDGCFFPLDGGGN